MSLRYERRYVHAGKVAHLVHYGETLLVEGQQPRLVSDHCEIALWEKTYYGTGSQEEREHAESLPLCTRCRKASDQLHGTIVSLTEEPDEE